MIKMINYITMESYLQGKIDKNGLTNELRNNMSTLLIQINLYLTELLDGQEPPVKLKVNCGYRLPYEQPKNGSPTSWHYKCGAIDLDDDDEGTFWNLVASKINLLTKYNLYMEDPRWTPGWLHFQVFPPKSGKHIFIPSSATPLVDRAIPK